MLINPFSQSNQPILLTKITERNGTVIKMTVKMHRNQPMNLFTKKSTERNVVMMKMIVRVHHHPNLAGGRTSLVKQGEGYTNNPPSAILSITIKPTRQHHYGSSSPFCALT